MAKTTTGSGRRWIGISVVAVGALFSFMFLSGGCKKESASEKAGREAREAFEKGKEMLKEGFDKTKDLTKEGLEKGGDAAKEGLEKSQEAAKAFSKGWNEGGKK
ncbi:MAG: hypothetical protein ACYC9Y_01395 [Candidatus Methylomirabilia bacterium]